MKYSLIRKVNMENNNNISKKFISVLIFPGIIITGFFLFLYSVLRFNHWDLIDIMFLAGIGVVLILLGIASYFKSDNAMTIAGTVLSGIAVVDFFWYSRRIEDRVAIFYSLGIIILLLNIIRTIKNRQSSPIIESSKLVPSPTNKPHPNGKPYEDVFDKEFDDKLQEFQEMHDWYLSFKKDDKSKLASMNESRKSALKKVLETFESLKEFLEKNKGKEVEGVESIRIKCDELNDELQDNIKQIPANAGETIFPDDEVKIYEIINKEERPRDFKGYPKIKRIIKPGYLMHSDEVLRKVRIEADWSSSDDISKR
jgi:hypothetical protein